MIDVLVVQMTPAVVMVVGTKLPLILHTMAATFYVTTALTTLTVVFL